MPLPLNREACVGQWLARATTDFVSRMAGKPLRAAKGEADADDEDDLEDKQPKKKRQKKEKKGGEKGGEKADEQPQQQ